MSKSDLCLQENFQSTPSIPFLWLRITREFLLKTSLNQLHPAPDHPRALMIHSYCSAIQNTSLLSSNGKSNWQMSSAVASK